MEQSLVDLYDKLMSNQDLLPPGAGTVSGETEGHERCSHRHLTLSSGRYGDAQLRQLAEHVLED